MKHSLSRLCAMALALACLASLTACGEKTPSTPDNVPDAVISDDATRIVLSNDSITVDGDAAPTDETAAVYTAHDIVYYESGRDFTYGEGTAADAHDASEADAHTVVHITEPGIYSVSGTLDAGQIAVDLGKGAKTDPDAVVELILDGVDLTCTVAPAIIFYNVYECDEAFVDYDDNDTETYRATKDVDTTAAGALLTLADGSENVVNGSYVARIYKPESVELSEDGTEVEDAKKLHKYDGAVYSKRSMNVGGSGTLTINAENEGLDTELHLTINGGTINIFSGNDGINTNEDEVSVTTVNSGTLSVIVTGETGEGDGIDSNGWIVINGGKVFSFACAKSMDSGLDADMGIYLNGGTVLATGNMYDRIDGGQNYAVFQFAERQRGDAVLTLKNAAGEVIFGHQAVNDYTYLVVADETLAAGDYTLWLGDTQLAGAKVDSMSGFGGGMPMGQPPEGFEPNDERPEPPEGFEPEDFEGMRGERPEPPEGFDPNGERPEPPEGFGGRGDGGRGFGTEAAERSTAFTITDGANFFTSIAKA